MTSRADNSGVLCVIGGFLVHLVLGTLYCWGNLTTYVTARLRLFDASISYDRTLLVFATCLGCQGCTMLAAGVVESRIGAKYTCLLGGYVLTAGVLLSSEAKSLFSLVLFNGAFFGVGLGLAYSPPISASARWFPEQKGLVTGIIISGFGGGAFVFGSIANALVNPDNLAVAADGYFDPTGPVASSVPHMYLFLGLLYFIFISIGGLLISEPSCEEVTAQNGSGYQILSEDCIESHITARDTIELDVTQVIRTPLAWHLALCLVSTAVGGMFLAGTFKTFALTSVDSLSLGIISTAASIFNSGKSLISHLTVISNFMEVGRIFWGAMGDRFGLMQTLVCLALGLSTIIFTYSQSLKFGVPGFALWTFLVFFFAGGNFALYMPITIQLFGSKNSSGNYGFIFFLYSMCNVVNIFVLSHLKVSFVLATLYMGVLTLTGSLIVLLLIRHHKRFEYAFHAAKAT